MPSFVGTGKKKPVVDKRLTATFRTFVVSFFFSFILSNPLSCLQITFFKFQCQCPIFIFYNILIAMVADVLISTCWKCKYLQYFPLQLILLNICRFLIWCRRVLGLLFLGPIVRGSSISFFINISWLCKKLKNSCCWTILASTLEQALVLKTYFQL